MLDSETTAGCTSWTYHPTPHFTCTLHNSIAPTKQGVQGVVSGIRNGSSPIPPKSCIGVYTGCFKDFVPAPGVPPVRPLEVLAQGPTANMSVQACAEACATRGYALAGVTAGDLSRMQSGQGATHDSQARSRGSKGTSKGTGMYSCYCGCALNQAAPTLPNASCAAPCAGAPPGDGPCGGQGAMATFTSLCTPWPGVPLPPSKCGSNGSHPLPPGPACSQPEAQQWKFCNTSVALDERVTDLVDRILITEAGPLLTARESPAIPRLGIPAFYWGTNAVHGVDWGNATTFPQALNMGCESPLHPPVWSVSRNEHICAGGTHSLFLLVNLEWFAAGCAQCRGSFAGTWNRTAMRGFGRVIGRELRALNNLGTAGVGLTSWSPTINLIRDPRWVTNAPCLLCPFCSPSFPFVS